MALPVQQEVTVVPVTSQIENSFALPAIKDFEKVITNKRKPSSFATPNNPTGYLYSRKEMEAFEKYLHQTQFNIISVMKLTVNFVTLVNM